MFFWQDGEAMGTAVWVFPPPLLEDAVEPVCEPETDCDEPEIVAEPVCEPETDCDEPEFVLEPVCEPETDCDEAEFVIEPVCEPVCEAVVTGGGAAILCTVLIAQTAPELELELELEVELALDAGLFEAPEEAPALVLSPPGPPGTIGTIGTIGGGEIGAGTGNLGMSPNGNHAAPPANIIRGMSPWLPSLVVIVVCAVTDVYAGRIVGMNDAVSVTPLTVAMTTDGVGV